MREWGVGMLGGPFIHYGWGDRHEDNSTCCDSCTQLCTAFCSVAGEALWAEWLAIGQGPELQLSQGQALLFCLLAAPDHFSLLPFIFPSDLLVPNDF